MHGSGIYTEGFSAILDTTWLQVLLQNDVLSNATHGLSGCPVQISRGFFRKQYYIPWLQGGNLNQYLTQILDNFKSYVLGIIKSTKEGNRL